MEVWDFFANEREEIFTVTIIAAHVILHRIVFNFFRGLCRVPPGFFLVKRPRKKRIFV